MNFATISGGATLAACGIAAGAMAAQDASAIIHLLIDLMATDECDIRTPDFVPVSLAVHADRLLLSDASLDCLTV